MIVNYPQYSRDWWLARKGRPSASQAGRIWTPPSDRYPLGQASRSDYAAELARDRAESSEAYLARVCPDNADLDHGETFQSAAMAQGRIHEPRTRKLYAEVLEFADVFEVGGVLTDWGFWASPDGMVAPNGVLEIKTPYLSTHLRQIAAWADPATPEIPREHLPQCHAQLIACEADWLDFVQQSYTREGVAEGPATVVRLYPNEYTATLEKALREFCEKLG